MAKNLLEFFKEIAKKAGIKIEDDKVKTFFTNAEFEKIEIPDDVIKPIETQLISIVDAKNNHSDIKNHYTKQALDTLDKTVDDLMDELGFSDDQKNEVKVERSSYKRAALVTKILQKNEQLKANEGKPDAKKFQDLEADLRAKLRDADAKVLATENTFKQKEKELRISYARTSLLANHKTINDSLPVNVRNTILNTLIDQELADKNAKIDFDENGNLVLLKKDGTNYFGDNNQQVNPQQFIEQTLSRNKMIVVNSNQQQNNNQNNSGQNNNNSGANQNNGQNNGGQNNNNNSNNQSKGATSLFKELMNESITEMNQVDPVLGGNRQQ